MKHKKFKLDFVNGLTGAIIGIFVIVFMLPFFVLWIVWEIFLGFFTDEDRERREE